MITLNIPDMTCGHCRSVICEAVFNLDEDAELSFDMTAKTVDIQSKASISNLESAIALTGYTVASISQPPPNSVGCCSHSH